MKFYMKEKINKLEKMITYNKKLTLFVIFIIIVGFGMVVTYAELVVPSSGVKYKETTAQDAIDDLYDKATTKLAEAEAKCPSGKACIDNNFNKDSWTTIKTNVESDLSYYPVGSIKTVNLGDLGIHVVRVANNTRPSECSTEGFSQTACGFVVEFADIITTHNMNPSGEYKGTQYNYGWNVDGYPASSMYEYLNSDVYNAIPEEVRNVMVNTKVVSGHGSTKGEENFVSTDKLYLLSPVEVWGTGGGANYDTSTGSSRQLDYYKGLGVTTSNYSGAIKLRSSSGSAYYWWLRSASSNNANGFRYVINNGYWSNTYASNTDGVSPAFRIA